MFTYKDHQACGNIVYKRAFSEAEVQGITKWADEYYNLHIYDTENRHMGHEYVDLGLPSGTLWATCNVGGFSPEDSGGYYAFGEILTKKDYTSSNYLKQNNDVANAMWGGDWRLPTKADLLELTKCTYKKAYLNGIPGINVIGLNGNTMFLPIYGKNPSYRSSSGYVISVEGEFLVKNGVDYYGCSVRAVMSSN